MQVLIDSIWILMSALLVLFMQAGFLCLETGMVRNKNSINVALKNLTDFIFGIAIFWLFGFGFMFGDSYCGIIGSNQFLLNTNNPSTISFFFFQAMFCATAVTIVSGAIAERVKFSSYLVIVAITSSCIYPVIGHWGWGGALSDGGEGWLEILGFRDFAGATVVHGVGGWVALSCLLIIGPRNGVFRDGKPMRLPWSNAPIVILGTMILWFGWFGFNGGSLFAFNDHTSLIIVRTLLAPVAGSITLVIVSYYRHKRLLIDYPINGVLSGLVSITACCHYVSIRESVLIGCIGALFCQLAIHTLEHYKIDDVIKAVPVHLVSGIWGTFSVGLFGDLNLLETGLGRFQQIQIQFLGIVACGLYSFTASYLILRIVNLYFPLRVSKDDEYIGLNVAEHKEGTILFSMLDVMDRHKKNEDLDKRLKVEDFTEIDHIAHRYNEVMDTLRDKTGSLEEEIIQREKAQKESEKMQSQLLQAQRMESIGQLAAGISHEINTPIQYIGDNTRFLKDSFEEMAPMLEDVRKMAEKNEQANVIANISDTETSVDIEFLVDEIPKAIDQTIEGIDHVSKIVNAMKEFSHPGSKEKANVDLNQSLLSTITVTRNKWKYIASMETDLDENLKSVFCLPNELNQVFLNLIINAVHAIESRNEKEKDQENGLIRIATKRYDDYAEISISDTGTGIPDEIQDKIFNPFFTTKEVGKGTGQGLSLAYSTIVDKHNGKINFETSAGKGTTFIIKLPYVDKQSDQIEIKEGDAEHG